MSPTLAVRQLRILSGTHAGASLDLNPGRHSLGELHDCDISITDWRFDRLSLRVGADGEVLAEWAVGESAHALRFENFMPIDFGGVVVCLGPCEEVWPERAQMLGALQTVTAAIAAPRLSQRLRKIDRRIVSGVVATLLSLVTVGWLATATSKPRDVPAPTLASSHAALQKALDGAVPGRLRVTEFKGGLVVEGLVDDGRQAALAAHAIDAMPPQFLVARHVSVATDVAETIRSAVGLAGARIAYRGNGVFDFSVSTDDVAATQSAVDRVAADLAPTVRRIDAVLQENAAARPASPQVLSALTTEDGVNVMETRDGVKHVVITDPMASPASEPVGP